MAASAQAAEVSCVVTGADGRPAAGARVYVDGLLRGAMTDAEGRFRIADLPPGSRTLVVERLGSARTRRELALDDARPATVLLTLGPNQALAEAGARHVESRPERMPQKHTYLAGLKPSPGRRPPNIVVVLFDDLGWGDLGAYGNRLIRTPHIDRAAADGVRMTEFYSASPVCSPSRAALLSGRYPSRALAANHVFFPENSSGHALRSAAGWPNALLQDEVLLPEVLARLGYRTALTGKWHLGDRAGHLPNDFGFERFYGVRYSNDMQPLDIWRNGSVELPSAQVEQGALTGLFAREALSVIRDPDPRPLFLMLAVTAPHVPHAAAPGFAGRSRAGVYGDMVEEADAVVGDIRAALRQAGKERDTLLVITSDNGADRRGDAGPFRGRKMEILEGGMRVPMIAVWPGRLPRGDTRDGMAMIFDLMPTVLRLVGAPAPQDRVIDGRDLMGLLTGRTASPHQTLLYTGAWSGRFEAIRDGRFKYRDAGFDRLLTPLYPGDFALPVAEPAGLTDLEHDTEGYDVTALEPERGRSLQAALRAAQAGQVDNPRGWR